MGLLRFEDRLIIITCKKGRYIMSLNQVTMVSLEQLVSDSHQYRRFKSLFNFKEIKAYLLTVESEANYKGYGVKCLFKCLLLQFMEDLSDQELERYIADSNAAKCFCDFSLTQSTPDYTVFSKMRKKLGTNLLSKIFAIFRDQLRTAGYMSEVFTFVDASHLISKASLWEERDEARRQKYEKLNNEILPKVARDKQDSKGYKHVMPNSGATYVDKGYCTKPAKQFAARKGVHLCAVKKNNMKGKNFDLDRYYTKLRAPFERVFAQDNKQLRYIGIAKNQFAEFMNAICFNLRRLIILTS
jgi:IS5 family transposase